MELLSVVAFHFCLLFCLFYRNQTRKKQRCYGEVAFFPNAAAILIATVV